MLLQKKSLSVSIFVLYFYLLEIISMSLLQNVEPRQKTINCVTGIEFDDAV